MATIRASQTKTKKVIESVTRELDRFKKLGKINSTYIVGLLPYALEDPEHRVYTNINLHTTETGRTSSTDPNLQNIVRPKPNLPDIRKLFKASEGRQFVQADYSQAELRVIAQLSQDPELIRVYAEGLDLHTEVATMFYGTQFTVENRQSVQRTWISVLRTESVPRRLSSITTYQSKKGRSSLIGGGVALPV